MSYGLVNKSSARSSRRDDEDALGMTAKSGPEMPLLTESLDSYGGRSNPYDQRDGGASGGGYNAPQAPYPSGGGQYNMPQPGGQQYSNQYSQPSMGRDNYGQNVEMAPLTQNGGSFGQGNPNAILNECREIDKGIDDIQTELDKLRRLQQRALADPDSSVNSATNREIDIVGSDTMTLYRQYAARIKKLKQQPESGSPKNAPQLGKVDRKLKAAINQYQGVESDYRKNLQAQMARQYKIVRPNASAEEVQDAINDTSSQQIFSQALLQSDRRGQSQAALAAVENRHVAIQKIEGQMIELAQLFQDMEALVVQQEAAVTVIEQKGEEVVENMDQGNQQISTAIVSARARNRKKWWCLLIVVIIIIIIVVVVLVYIFVIKGTNKAAAAAKRSIMDTLSLQARYVTESDWSGESKAIANTRSIAGRFLLPG